MIREPAVAGQFYPGSAPQLRKMIKSMVDEKAEKTDAIGLVLPHAGFVYSGPVVGAVLSRVRMKPTAVILCPNHTGRGKLFSLMAEGAWKTPLGQVDITGDWPNMYWRSGQRIMQAAELVRRDGRLNALYITNYGCGPDSFLTKYFRETMGEKPYLQLEVDEHSADAGAITRCEAFLDSVEQQRRNNGNGKVYYEHLLSSNPAAAKPVSRTASLAKRTVYIPSMAAHAYAIRAARAAVVESERDMAGRLECQWQREQLPDTIRDLVLDDQRLRNDICWFVFNC